ncbi:Transmembrane protein 56-B [Morella rubra]|uniref:Transmembrane protein 56-B n=1 Tax=Morella rubra TaxID=262757 RepID=A0A6A1WRL0_9ROSI|nr:Transmembrane protein 56-B [Morella rubra]
MGEFPFPLPHDFLSNTGNIGPTKGYIWLVSVFSGIIICTIILNWLLLIGIAFRDIDGVYKLTGFISLQFFKGYGKLSSAQRVEWNNRGFSTFHALLVASASLYFLLLSDEFDENSHGDSIVFSTSTLSDILFGISIGYFLSDLAMILWHFPALGGLEYLLHHGLSMYSIFLSLISGQAQVYILMVLFTEMTTPFINLRWYLDVAGQKNSKLYTYNGIALFLGWLLLNRRGTLGWAKGDSRVVVTENTEENIVIEFVGRLGSWVARKISISSWVLWVSVGVRAFGEVVSGQAWSEVPLSGYKDVCSISKSVGNFPSVTSEIGPAELYAASHKRKNGDWLSDVAKDNHEKMRELQEQAISDGRSYTDIDILHQVLGPKPGYVRGLGRAVKPPRTSGSSSTSVARQLREAQLEIDRLKAEREAKVEHMRIEREAEMERM